MTNTAALWTSWQASRDPRRPDAPILIGPSGALPAGVSFLPNELGGARLVVEAAFGANLADTTEASWTWYDISADVHYDPGIHITIGRQSESLSAPPAECTFELDNTSNKYSPFNPLATYWPNVKEGTPIRVRIIISGVSYTRFQGRAIGFNPTPDSTGYHQMITVTAAGVTRVLGQQSDPIISPFTRAVLSASATYALRAYWSLEDSQHSTSAASQIPGVAAMTTGGSTIQMGSLDPTAAAYQVFGSNQVYGTAPLPNFKTSGFLSGVVPAGGPSSAWTVQIGAYVNTFNDSTTSAIIGQWSTSGGTHSSWQLIVDDTIATPGTRVVVTTPGGVSTTVINSAITTGAYTDYRIDATQSGGNISVTLTYAATVVATGTLTTATLGSVQGSFTLNPNFSSYSVDVAIGHIRVWDTTSAPNFQVTSGASSQPWWGYYGETPDARLARICSDNNIEFNTLGFYSTNARMGAQENADFMTIARSCETTEAGWLYDGLSGGISFEAPSQRYDQFSQFTLDGTRGEVQPDLWPVQDDYARANKVTITRTNGSSATYEDTSGSVGTNAVGVYTGNAPTDTNYQDDSFLDSRARWEVHKGTHSGFRWPTVNVNVRKIPDRATAIAGMTPGLMFTIFPLPTRYQEQYGTDPLNLIAEGWSEFLTNLNWEIAFNCSMQDIYNVWKIGDSQLGRVGTSGHTLAGDVAAGASIVTLATPIDKALWTTAAGDFPMTILVDGIKITLTNITGSSSPQTGTVDTVNTPIPRLIQSGQAVSMWKNGVIKL